MKHYWIIVFTYVILLGIYINADAQSFVNFTDEQWIELRLDFIRKGVQQQDTMMISLAFGGDVLIMGESRKSNKELCSQFADLFANAENRTMLLTRPSLARSDSRLLSSQLWDFDILNPDISIAGDTATVDCELVLWGASPEAGGKPYGIRSQEQFVFVVPEGFKPAKPRSAFSPLPKRISRQWDLVGFNNLLEFLEGSIEDCLSSDHEKVE